MRKKLYNEYCYAREYRHLEKTSAQKGKNKGNYEGGNTRNWGLGRVDYGGEGHYCQSHVGDVIQK